ncbi:hypothetical protein GM3709_394 [Geminocystis sp. NIES-3709]|nr:hypothetical protein GM3709_394 [Geminocystis sp. NIES-3709]
MSIDRKGKKQGGFSVLEVLVTILVLSGFLLGSLQATVLATLLRVQAQDKQDAANWLQQDLELVRYQAFLLDNPTEASGLTPTKANACSGSTYGQRLQDFIDGVYASTATVTVNTKSYNVTRTYTNSGNILRIAYLVEYGTTHPRYKGSGANNTLAELSTEVIPNAALSCS